MALVAAQIISVGGATLPVGNRAGANPARRFWSKSDTYQVLASNTRAATLGRISDKQEWVQTAAKCVENKTETVNSPDMRASTKVMAAGTAIEQMTVQTAEELSAQEFARVVETHRPQIFRFLLSSTRDVDLAETLTQECFLKAHRNWSHFRGESTAMTWLMRIAINLQKDHWRNRRMQFWRQTRSNSVDVDEASEWLPSGERSAEQQLLAREQVGRVWKAVEGLSERQRTVFLLRYVEERELSDIAAATGLSEGTIKAHLSRALAKVRAELGGKR
jgi:RNA polymerase sigma-70 factor (ECF subfamily)